MTTTADTRILIVRLSAVGDVIHSLPLACALRERFPAARIGWVVEKPSAALLENHPAVDRLFVLPRGWPKRISELRRLRAELRAERFTVAIDPQGLLKSAIPVWLSGAKRRIGFDRSAAREGAWLAYTDRVAPTRTHVIDRNLELLRPLGIDTPAVRWNLPVWPEAQTAIDGWLAENGLIAGAFAVFNPGAGWASKRWPPERYGELALSLQNGRCLPVVVPWYGVEEKAMAEAIVAGAGGDGLARLAPPTALPGLAGLFRRARLFVGSDSGPLHLAVAVGTPCVGLFGPMPAERNGPYGPAHRSVQKMVLTGTSRERRNAGPESMAAISVADATAACEEVLASS